MYSKDFYDDDDDNVSVSSFTSGSDEDLDMEQEDAKRRKHVDHPPLPLTPGIVRYEETWVLYALKIFVVVHKKIPSLGLFSIV